MSAPANSWYSDHTEKMKAIIAGASGYIGKPLYIRLSEVFETYGTSSSVSGKAGDVFLQLRLDAPQQFDYALIGKSDAVFLAAAISAPDACSRERDRATAVNVTGTSAFIERVIARGGRIIFFSSDTVYGEKDEAFDERAPCRPAGEYAEMKHEVESRFLGNPLFKSIRLSYVFSREDKFTRYLSDCAGRGDEAEIFHPYSRAVIHRDDVVQGALALVRRWEEFPQSVINFGGPEVLDRTEFAQVLKETALPALRFRITEPEAGFFRNRPRIIRMASPVMASLLGREAHSLREAATIEFNLEGNRENG